MFNMENLFGNPGGKLKKLALAIFWIEFIGGMISALIAIFDLIININGAYFLLLPVAFIIVYGIAWLSAIVLYALGDHVENLEQTKNLLYSINKKIPSPQSVGNSSSSSANKPSSPNPSTSGVAPATTPQSPNVVVHKPQETPAPKTTVEEKSSSANESPSKSSPYTPSQKEKLTYALKYSSVDSMKSYLRLSNDPIIQRIINLPDDQIVPTINKLIEEMNSASEENS